MWLRIRMNRDEAIIEVKEIGENGDEALAWCLIEFITLEYFTFINGYRNKRIITKLIYRKKSLSFQC